VTLLSRTPERTELPAALDRRFEAVVFDWDGTAVPDRQADATRVRELIEELCGLGLDLAVITGTHVGNVDGQLSARPDGPGRLYLCMNRGSEVFRADTDGVHLLERREATAEEDAALDAAAENTVSALAARGLRAEIVSQRLNRRKIDLIPEPVWADPPKARIAELLGAVQKRLHDAGLDGLQEAVEIAQEVAYEAGLPDARVTSDAKHVEIGLTDKADAARWVLDDLRRRGIGAGLVLVAGDEFGPLGGLPGSDSLLLVPEAARATAISVGAEPTGTPPDVIALGGGPDAFLALLEDQLERRRRHDVPQVDADADWTLTVDGFDPQLARVHESLLAVADGRVGIRGAPALAHPGSERAIFVAGAYEGEGPETTLTTFDNWPGLLGDLPPDPLLRRRLDLRSGVLREDLVLPAGPLSLLQFPSLVRPGTVALRASGPSSVVPPDGRLDRFAVYGSDEREKATRLAAAKSAGFEALLAEHRDAWARRWEEADVVIEGDQELQRAVRFTLFHLMASVADEGEAAVGARGLSGPAYRGHVFWDGDVFVLPFLAATHPSAARAMLEYRIRRLPAAIQAARRLGRQGARFPWESAGEGVDVTPRSARDRAGRVVRIRTGELEEHIVADVAWATACYLDWTGDEAFASGPGRELIVEAARYWASRIRIDGNGRGHIYGVIGPDEYHEPVDDNAYTNVMARWNLRRAAALAGTAAEERAMWLQLADALVDGYDADTGLYEEFAGFFRLEPLRIADIAPRRPISADLLLGPERVDAAQVVKQADVLMLHHLVPDEVVNGSLGPNLEFYEPRTAHGSSLSPAIHASLFARAGLLSEAVAALRLAAQIDLDDLTGTTAGGLHLATMGGLWQALVFGFAGARPRGERLELDPRLPEEWQALELRLSFRGSAVRVRIEHDRVDVDADPPVPIDIRSHPGVN
jgi:trehalose/maltose hydrolase-like predicted phosphorylase/hydroxymethylpyrimidine pyrophosphatase-like HAD family hydrolase